MPYTTKGLRGFKSTGNPLMDAMQIMSLAPSPMGMAAEEDDLLAIAGDLLNALKGGDKATAAKLGKTLEDVGKASGNKVIQEPMSAAKTVLAPDPKIPGKQFGGKTPTAAPQAAAEDPAALIGELVDKMQGGNMPQASAPSAGPSLGMSTGPSAQKIAKGLRNEPRTPKGAQAASPQGATTGVHANQPAWKNPETWMSAEEKAYKQDFPKLQQPTGKMEPSPAEMEAIKAGKLSFEDWMKDSYQRYKMGLEQHKVDMMRQNYELMRRLGMLAKKKAGE